jgi:hypothetical protein
MTVSRNNLDIRDIEHSSSDNTLIKKAKLTLEQATKAQRGSRGISLFFL